jgi:hypothetical protein
MWADEPEDEGSGAELAERQAEEDPRHSGVQDVAGHAGVEARAEGRKVDVAPAGQHDAALPRPAVPGLEPT